MRKVGGRECLLLDFAAERTLATVLREDGTQNLDYAKRYGDDLLQSVQYLEEQGIQHRDIKPSNIGFTPDDKKARHLILFDFSLTEIDATLVQAGTAAYRDPFLRRRGRWDHAADRYAVAVTLYQMLTGLLPVVAEADSGGRSIRIEAELFDAAVRDRLIAFFNRAFAADVADRFPNAEDMRTGPEGWVSVFGAQPAAKATTTTTSIDDDDTTVPEGLPFDRIRLDTPVDALALSPRARNALDRAGVLIVKELLDLPRNHLSAIRGVGHKVAREIQHAAQELRTRFGDEDLAPAAPFAPDFTGPQVALRIGGALDLDARSFYRLRDAGITTSTELASTPADRIEHLLGKPSAKKLATALGAADFARPQATLDDWATELLASKKAKPSKPERQVRAYLGLEAAPGVASPPEVPTVREIASAFKVSSATILRNVGRTSEHWLQCAGLPSLVSACGELVDARGGACLLTDLRDELLRVFASGAATADARKKATALVRLTTELDADDVPEALVLGRLSDQAWIARSDDAIATVRRLGEAVDALAKREPLPSSETVKTALAAIVQDTPLASLPADRVARTAVAASDRAALSSRLEVYPRGMSAERALMLAGGVLSFPEITPEDLRERVTTRYPEAAPLPERPALDELLAKHGLDFAEGDRVYRRRGQIVASTSFTARPPTRLPTALPSQALRLSPTAQEARAFDEAVRGAMERGRFRVIQTPIDEKLTPDYAALALKSQLGFTVISLDAALWSRVEALSARDGVPLDTILDTDRGGPDGDDWRLLCGLVEDAAKEAVTDVLAHRDGPQALIHPGAIARFDLSDALQTLVDRADAEEGAAVFLLVPAHDDGSVPAINHSLPVPTLPAQRLRMPRSWLRNEHHAARPDARDMGSSGPSGA